ncbi:MULTISPECIES: CBS domain-containing protein [unclassified Archaeoglobus]|uniref:CBS domain-containing protein n=1 Tax=unclassified Archaeoglobus TaxID=2643606 RepID=UPI0025BA0807|nr:MULTISPECIES: CBS domain-containing protein [unclassified Archaeoglobus]
MKNSKPGNVMEVATKEVFTLPPTSTLMYALKTMVKENFRRIPITDAGTKRLEGIISATDFVNLFGGGSKFGIVKGRYGGNLAAAVNEEVEKIMETKVITVDYTDSFEDAVEVMFEKRVGGCPIVNKEDVVVGIITERDVLKYLGKNKNIDGIASDYMTNSVVTIKPKDTIEKAMKVMIEKHLRRLPVIDDGILVGLITVREILRYFGKGEAFRMLTSGSIKDAIEKPVSTILANDDLLVYKEILTFPRDISISQLVSAMLDRGYGVALIVESGKLEGIITERDLIRFLYSKS